MLDDSHPTIRDAHGPCISYFVTDPKFPGSVKLCILKSNGKCSTEPDWTYTTEFASPANTLASKHVTLQFASVDYSCDVWLNGAWLEAFSHG